MTDKYGPGWYESREIDRVTDSDPEGFYRLRIESDRTGEATRHLNITRDQLDRIRAVFQEAATIG